MSRIREEETRLLKLASELEGNPFQELFSVSKDTESCFMQKEETDYITDYGFQTPMELIRLLTDMWEGETCQKYLLAAEPCIAAAVFKQEPDHGRESGQGQSGIEVPMYIYNF